jgi:methylenetetrahydrofolate dehydrogenase (NADP+)/methenyltetrahydrofolate cyclohydrolase
MIIIDGKQIAKEKREALKLKAAALKQTGRAPAIAVILVGNNSASEVYVSSKIKACHDVGIESVSAKLASSASKDEIIQTIEKFNNDPNIDGILLQLPLPDSSMAYDCINAISPSKDVDGLTIKSLGKLLTVKKLDDEALSKMFIACTPLAIMEMLEASKISPAGKTAVIVGRSELVGKPLAALMLAKDATVICAHSKTKDLKILTRLADILVIAIGKPKFINADYVKDGAVVIDVGINRLDGKIVGDVDFESLNNSQKNLAVSPVPGGVGPMTITCLLENTVKAYMNKRQGGLL